MSKKKAKQRQRKPSRRSGGERQDRAHLPGPTTQPSPAHSSDDEAARPQSPPASSYPDTPAVVLRKAGIMLQLAVTAASAGDVSTAWKQLDAAVESYASLPVASAIPLTSLKRSTLDLLHFITNNTYHEWLPPPANASLIMTQVLTIFVRFSRHLQSLGLTWHATQQASLLAKLPSDMTDAVGMMGSAPVLISLTERLNNPYAVQSSRLEVAFEQWYCTRLLQTFRCVLDMPRLTNNKELETTAAVAAANLAATVRMGATDVPSSSSAASCSASSQTESVSEVWVDSLPNNPSMSSADFASAEIQREMNLFLAALAEEDAVSCYNSERAAILRWAAESGMFPAADLEHDRKSACSTAATDSSVGEYTPMLQQVGLGALADDEAAAGHEQMLLQNISATLDAADAVTSVLGHRVPDSAIPAAASATNLLLLHLDRLLQQLVTPVDGSLGSSNSSSTECATPIAPAALQLPEDNLCMQNYHEAVLESFWERTEVFYCCWQRGCIEASRVEADLGATLAVLLQQLQRTTAQLKGSNNDDQVPSPTKAAQHSLLPQLMLVLLELAYSSRTTGSSSNPGDAKAATDLLQCAAAAAETWLAYVTGPDGLEQLDSIHELLIWQAPKLAAKILQQVISQAAVSDSIYSSSTTSTDTSIPTACTLQLLTLAGYVLQVQVSTCQSVTALTARAMSPTSLISEAAASAEHYVRLAALAVQRFGLSLQSEAVVLVQQASRLLEGLSSAVAHRFGCSPAAALDEISQQHWALLLSFLKLCIRDSCGPSLTQLAVLNAIVTQYLEAYEVLQLPTAAPWLLLKARVLLAQTRQAALLLQRLQQPEHQSATAEAMCFLIQEAQAPATTEFEGSSVDGDDSTDRVAAVFDSLQQLAVLLKTVTVAPVAAAAADVQEQQQQQQEEDSCAYLELGLLQKLEQLLQQWNDGLLTVAAAAGIILQSSQYPILQLKLIADSTIFGLPLLHQIEAAANQLCALLPTALCCNNPDCCNIRKESELQLVAEKHCTGCGVARYCGRKCQVAHWQEHKRVCRMIRENKAAAAAAAAT